jgi:exonuclease-1
MHRVRMLIHFGVTPYLVFDGDNLPSKAGTEKGRRERRKEGKRLGLELLEVGKTAQAQQELQKSVDVTPEMARMVIEELKHTWSGRASSTVSYPKIRTCSSSASNV